MTDAIRYALKYKPWSSSSAQMVAPVTQTRKRWGDANNHHLLKTCRPQSGRSEYEYLTPEQDNKWMKSKYLWSVVSKWFTDRWQSPEESLARTEYQQQSEDRIHGDQCRTINCIHQPTPRGEVHPVSLWLNHPALKKTCSVYLLTWASPSPMH